MASNYARVSRCLAFLWTGAALALGAWLFGRGVQAQWHRVMLERAQGLGFADPACTTGYCDYTMFWVAGFLVRHHQAAVIYDHARYAAAAARVLPYRSGFWPFVYPPPFLPLAAAISAAPLVAGYYGFSVLCAVSSVWLLRRAGVAWWCIAAGLMGPAAMWGFYLGQFGLLCGAVLVAGLAWLGNKPLKAGGMLALLAVKPQYALLVPVAVVAGRYWRAMAAGVAGAALLVGASLLCGGAAIWARYAGPGRAAMAALMIQGPGAGSRNMGTCVFWMVRDFGAGLAVALAAQLLVTGLAGFAVWRLWRQPAGEPGRRLVLSVLLTLLAMPYGFTDDLAIYGVMLPLLARRGRPWRNAGLAWAWVAPAFVPRFVEVFGFLPTPLLLMAVLGLAWRSDGCRVG